MKPILLVLLILSLVTAVGCDRDTESTPDDQTTRTAGAAAESDDEPQQPQASDDAARAAEEGPDCATAYQDTKKLFEGLRETVGKDEADTGEYELLPRDEWIERCEKLPPPMQKCLSIKYAVPNKGKCQQAQESLDATQSQTLKELMGK